MGPPITLFLTTIASHPELRRRQEYLLRILQVKKIPFQAYDMASDEQARRLWKRKVPPAKQQLPGFLVDNTFIGTVDEFEVAVERGDPALRKFLRLDEEYNPDVDRPWITPAPEAVAIGVPGAQLPSEISGHKPVFHNDNKPIDKSKIVKHDKKLAEGEIDLTEALGDFGLEGVTVTEDELLELVASLGLEDKQADELVKGITESSAKSAERNDEAAAKASPKAEEVPKPKQSTSEPKISVAAMEEALKGVPSLPPIKAVDDAPAELPIVVPTIITAMPQPTPPPPKPVVKIDTSLAPKDESAPVSSQPSNPPSSVLLTPNTGIMASREIMKQLAKKVQARKRTDAKPKRIPSLSPMSATSPSPLESPLPDVPPEPVEPEQPIIPIRERKPSVYESSKPKVAFPVSKDDAPPSSFRGVASTSPSPQAVPLPTSSPVPISPATTPNPPSGIPVRERKRSAYGATKPKLPTTSSPKDPPLPSPSRPKS
ncbi:hypothetical protein FRB99_006591 [Tulasnella sp. 403]|nr:hypothetical protein FRB99_006591 [Tulasnella sp. 403]